VGDLAASAVSDDICPRLLRALMPGPLGIRYRTGVSAE
jgi:hypothetical protein